MENQQVNKLMERNLKLINADATLEEASIKMKQAGCGFLPVGVENTLEGIITDRDIVVRAIAEGRDPTREIVRDYMTSTVCCCKESDTLKDAAQVMSENHVSRLVVKDENDNICGILTFGRIIRSNDNKQETSEVVERATGKAA
ncbi:CBS domain-containing protein [Nitrosomonas ureae]|uniref:CBS domain-containing protein n=1 Tax=Nitrosomonas ureae TaxID=44577 RepID=A0A1H2HQK4_9PROT|nr:CBS domain-containing protein [Nitrosomonas ureae]ALQ51852.1 signal transduction protein [Nitrosomonas ureae]MBY0498147.1 CBS domain-containing protein [Nitrosomonas sp.]SDU34105.1 CBS domain-containing protein [Nitrosomonas ureae]